MLDSLGGEWLSAERVLRQHERGPHADRGQRRRHLRRQHGRQEAPLGRIKESRTSFTSLNVNIHITSLSKISSVSIGLYNVRMVLLYISYIFWRTIVRSHDRPIGSNIPKALLLILNLVIQASRSG